MGYGSHFFLFVAIFLFTQFGYPAIEIDIIKPYRWQNKNKKEKKIPTTTTMWQQKKRKKKRMRTKIAAIILIVKSKRGQSNTTKNIELKPVSTK